MKRALVRKYGTRCWHVCFSRHGVMIDGCATIPTHAEALAHALHEVGLTPANPEPIEAP